MSEGMEWFYELQIDILHNFIEMMPKVYRKRNCNWIVVRDILLYRTTTSGKTSCIKKCLELGIDPFGYTFKSEVKE